MIDLFPADGPRLFTVGRLDENSEGLLIVTNDGELANQLAHPRFRIDRIYHVQVAGHPDRELLGQLTEGMYFADGKFKAESAKPLKKQGKSTFLEIRLREGKNREVRRLMARVGHKVMRLQRVGFGPIRLGRVKAGEYRELRPEEVRALRELVQKTSGERPAPRQRRPAAGKRRTGAPSATSGRRTSGNKRPARGKSSNAQTAATPRTSAGPRRSPRKPRTRSGGERRR